MKLHDKILPLMKTFFWLTICMNILPKKVEKNTAVGLAFRCTVNVYVYTQWKDIPSRMCSHITPSVPRIGSWY